MALSTRTAQLVGNFAAASGGMFAASFIQLNPSPAQISFMVGQINPQIAAVNAALADIDNYKQARLDALNLQLTELNTALTEIQALGT